MPLDEAPQALGGRYLVGHENGVDDMDDAIRLEDVGCGDGGRAAPGFFIVVILCRS